MTKLPLNKLMDNKNKIDAGYLARHFETQWSKIKVFEVIDSTSSWLKEQTEYPLVCLAEEQTNGRGRNGNRWHSPDAENIYLSFNWLFGSQPKHLPLLSLWIGIAVAQAIESLGVNGHGIKWPNDLYWLNKKLGGILIETSSASSGVIVGIGINTNVLVIDGVDQPWTSLSNILGGTVDRNKLLITLLDELWRAMIAFQQLTPDTLRLSWSKWDLLQDKQVSFQKNGEILEGIARGINASGYLLVEMLSGDVIAFNTSISKVRW